LNYSEDTAVWTSLLWAFGTLAFPYSSSLFHQVTATLLMVYVVRFAFSVNVVGTAITSALLVSVQLTLAATVLPLFLARLQAHRRPSVGFWSLLLGIFGGFGLHVLTNALRGDHWLHGAYETETFTTPTFVGTVGVFFSSGKGLLWFAPLAFVGLVMLLPFAYRRPEIGRPLLFAVTCHCLVVIHWWAWHGSLSWGPRLLLPILPLMMIPIADLIERRQELPTWQSRLVGSVAAVSMLINVWAATQPMIGFLNAVPDGAMSEWVFVPSLAPFRESSLVNAAFLVRFEWTAFSTTLVVSALAFMFLGAMLVSRLNLPNWRAEGTAPWRAIGVLILSLIPNIATTSPPGDHHQRVRLSWIAPVHQGELRFPIRGVYRIETTSGDSGTIRIGDLTLSKRNRAGYIEAPPMSVPIMFNNTGSTLLWTLPGEGQFRSPIPKEQFSSKRFLEQYTTFDALKNWNWLLLLLAVPLYFDWLLGGRRMKEPSEPGTEANA